MSSRRTKGIVDRPEPARKRRKAASTVGDGAAGSASLKPGGVPKPTPPKKATRGTECALCSVAWAPTVAWGQYDDGGAAVGALCHGCEATWSEAYFYIPRDTVLAQAQTDEEFKTAFAATSKLRKDKAVLEFKLAEVCKANRAGYRLRRRFTGYNRATFIRKFEVTPEELGLKPVDLQDELGDHFQCYLLQDDPAEPRTVDVFFETSCDKSEFAVHPQTMLHGEQAAEGYKYITAEPKSSLVRKMGKVWTTAKVAEAISTLREMQRVDELGSASEHGGDDDDNEEAAGRVNAEGNDAAEADSPQARATPNPLLDGVRAPGSRGASSGGLATPRALSTTAGSVIGLPAFRRMSGSSKLDLGAQSPALERGAGPARTVDEHIARLNLCSILAGAKCGSDRRWAQKYVDDNHETDADCTLLSHHLAAVAAATNVAERMTKMSDVELKSNLDVLDSHGAEWPSNLKGDFIDRKVTQWLQTPDRFAQSSYIIEVLIPWEERSVSENDPEKKFKPLEPRTSLVEGSVLEKSKHFKHTVIKRILAPAIKAGEECHVGVRKFCGDMVTKLESIDDIDEDYGTTVQDLLKMCRVVASIIDGAFVTACGPSEIEDLKKGLDSKSTKSMMAILSTTVMQNEYYKLRLDELEKYAVANLEYGGRITECLAGLSAVEVVPDISVVKSGVDLISEVTGKVNPTISSNLLAKVKEVMAAVADDCTKKLDSGEVLSWNCQDLEQLIASAQEKLGVDAALQSLATAISLVKKQESAKAIVAECSKACETASYDLKHVGAISDGSFTTLSGLLRQCQGEEAENVTDEMVAFVTDAVENLFTMHQQEVVDCQRLADLVVLCCGWKTTVTIAKQEWPTDGVCKFLTCMLQCMASTATMMAERADRKLQDKSITTHLSLRAQLDGFEKTLPNLPPDAKTVTGEVKSAMDAETKECMIQSMAAQEAEVRFIAGGDLKHTAGGGDQESPLWTNGLESTATFQETVQHARETLDRAKGSEIKKGCDRLEKAIQRYLDVAQMYGKVVDPKKLPEWLDIATKLLRAGRATIITACMLGHMKATHTNPVKLKNLIRTQTTNAGTNIFGASCRELIHPAVLQAAEEALNMRLKWPGP